MNHRPGDIFNQKKNPESIEPTLIYSLLHRCIRSLIESSSWWGWWMMMWLRRECCSSVFHQCHQKMMAMQPTWPVRRWWYNCEEHDERWWWHDDMTTWWHNNKIFIMKDDGFMMTWWQTWLEGKTRWPLVDWGAVRDSVLEGDRCCAKRYRKWQSLNSWLNIYA